MGKKTKTTFKTYAAWDFLREAEEYNAMSEKGWQLVEGGCFHQKYEFDDSVVYRYQLDFNNKIQNMAQYDEIFRDSGWERVNSTFNGWHIFRKAYDPSLPDDEYQIYTDNQSRIEMLNRWRSIFVIITMLTVSSSITPINLLLRGAYNIVATISLTAIYLLFAFIFVNAFIGINNLIHGRQNKARFPFNEILATILVLLIIFTFSSSFNVSSIWFALGILAALLLVVLAVFVFALVSSKKKSN